MLKLTDIKKTYTIGENKVKALNGVSVTFRKSEFVAVLGPSGCGKTTLLNIIGGLDRYDSGNLIINGKSTSSFKDSDWDSYRNHSIGFVFQSYNLIGHQTVLSNVELALTLSGVSKTERRKRAKDVLERVGLGDQLYKKPNQMSGGQMQRVAIARALVNDPDILLADEPTGALDSETSVQIMEILKEISGDKLIIMVTHNPELAEQYSNRLIRLIDGKLVSDSRPIEEGEEEFSEAAASSDKKISKKERKKLKTSMSFLTALSLSLNNLLTKKGRTFLTAFAGSIGIIGIALILSLSSGFQNYIDKVQEDTLSSYPLTIMKQTTDTTGMLKAMSGNAESTVKHDRDKVYNSSAMTELINSMMAEIKTNDMKSFKSYIDEKRSEIDEYVTDIQFGYDVILQIYSADTSEKTQIINPNPFVDEMYLAMGYDMNSAASSYSSLIGSMTSLYNTWIEMLGNRELLETQYDVIAGEWPENYNEVVLVVDENNEITDLTLYSLGLKDAAIVKEYFQQLMSGQSIAAENISYEYSELLNMDLKLVLNTDYYRYDEMTGGWIDMRNDADFMKQLVNNAESIKISGIIRPKAEAAVVSLPGGTIGYTHALTEYVVGKNNASEIAIQQKADIEKDVFTGVSFVKAEEVTIDDVYAYIDSLSEVELAQLQMLFNSYFGNSFGRDEIETAINSMSDEELVAAFAPVLAANITVEQVKGYIAAMTQEQRDALTAGIAASVGADPSSINLDAALAAKSDGELIEMFSPSIVASVSASDVRAYIDALTDEELSMLASSFDIGSSAESIKAMLSTVDESMLISMFKQQMDASSTDNTLDGNLSILGAASIDSPSHISLYPKDFESKEKVEEFIAEYNDSKTNEADKIDYTDYIGVLLSSVTTIINTISYVLIAFVGISLIVSSIMIGIITYISVLERTKEIGILRSIGASKKDVSRVFNAETLIVGFVSGALGIIITILLDIPINLIIESISDIPNVARLPWQGGLILVVISMFLTLIAGLIPSRIASKKDPVAALRVE